jgi:hypothetical protein
MIINLVVPLPLFEVAVDGCYVAQHFVVTV